MPLMMHCQHYTQTLNHFQGNAGLQVNAVRSLSVLFIEWKPAWFTR